MAQQLQSRRGTEAQLKVFTGAQGEITPATDTMRLRVNDGATTGGFPHALETRSSVSDAAYAALITDRLIAYTALTAARIVTLPSAASYPSGARLTVADETGACSTTNTITIARAGSDVIAGGAVSGTATSAVLNTPFAELTLESNGVSQWTITHVRVNSTARTPVADSAYSRSPPTGSFRSRR